MESPTELKMELTISGRGSDMAAFYIQVGRGLSIWAITENALSEMYCMIVCGQMSPAEGAATTFSLLRSLEDRINIITKCMDQVLYPSKFDTFRKDSKRKLNRIRKLAETRNKIAHGAALRVADGVNFFPYFMRAENMRVAGLHQKLGHHPSTVKKPPIWNKDELTEKVDSLMEASSIAHELIADLQALYEENSELLQDTTRMFARRGLPYKHHPKDPS